MAAWLDSFHKEKTLALRQRADGLESVGLKRRITTRPPRPLPPPDYTLPPPGPPSRRPRRAHSTGTPRPPTSTLVRPSGGADDPPIIKTFPNKSTFNAEDITSVF